jgi:cobalt/nickel transport protein
MRRRTFFVLALAVALLVAGAGSYYASSHPDGLEYVAEQTGFQDKAEDSKTADGPLADYRAKGVEDERLGGGLAGAAGVLVVLVLMGGLAFAIRRRGPSRDEDRA